MRTHARAVVIGGGVVGVSTLYHLAKKGWTDVVLIERKELTSGSTWHAAGLLPLFNLSYSVGQIHKYSVALYQTLEAETGPECRLRQVSNIRLARTSDRWDEYMYYAGVAETIGVKVNVLTPDEVKEIWPLCETDGIIGAIQHPDDGYIQPADLTQALAKGARDARRRDQPQHDGHRHRADAGRRMAGQDRQGRHHLRARRLGDRQFRAADRRAWSASTCRSSRSSTSTSSPSRIPRSSSARRRACPRWACCARADSSWYMREENGGLLLGPYEKGAPACYVDGPSADSRIRALPGRPRSAGAAYRDGDRARAGLRRGRRQEGLQRRHRLYARRLADRRPGAGTCRISGSTRAIPSASPRPAAPAGSSPNGSSRASRPSTCSASIRAASAPTPTRGYLNEKNEEAYAKVFTVALSRRGARGRAAAEARRPAMTRMKALGAVFGSVYGWERPNWFAPQGYGLSEADLAKPDVLLNENHPAGRAPASSRARNGPSAAPTISSFVGDECRNVHENVGLQDMSAFAKCEVSGPGARRLARFDPRQPHPEEDRPHRALPSAHRSAAACAPNSRLRASAPERFYLVSAGALERHDHDILEKLLPADGSVRLDPVTTAARRARARRARARARSCRSSPTPTSPTRPSPGSPARRSVDRRRGPHRAAGQFRRRARLRAASSDRDAERYLRPLMEAGAPFGIKPFGIRAMHVAGGGEVLPARSGANCRSNMPRSNPVSTASSISTRAVSRPRRARRLERARASRTGSSRWRSKASPMPTRAAPSRS